ncbi:YqaA family protein [Paremcibacter congregatus]|uniref:Cytochrome B n=1 Tax=Paremcibacter congregatus TaxID=2043170 RepID=A0A2G4YQN5_9PROT|nr:YqaA family protein [Paremcibacter congregatus]PHZ84632.1 cytochrome B [Paremcibacter congregatus]QDE28533.1 DedA family protein [Paremcibacter congregatus]|tara:strand:+ start:4295 stop:4873 length:579 start_codon:yes stop_codon:yes gene_type:complete
MLRRLYDWTLEKAEHPKALWILALFSFAESSFFPIPPDVLLIPMVIAAPTRAWRIAFVCSTASVFGGLFGYYIGAVLYETVGDPIVAFYHMQAQYERFTALYSEHGAWIVSLAGFSPIPYKVFTIASGVAHLDLTTFLIASTVSRAARFFLVAALLWKFGIPIRDFIERRLGLLTLTFSLLLVGSFLALKYV